MIWLGIILLVASIAFNLIHTDRLLKTKGSINHAKDWLIKAATCLPAVIILHLAMACRWYIALPVSAGLCGAWFWLLFSGIYGWRVARDFFYRGTVGFKAASDTIPRWLSIFLKVGGCVVMSYLYIKLQ